MFLCNVIFYHMLTLFKFLKISYVLRQVYADVILVLKSSGSLLWWWSTFRRFQSVTIQFTFSISENKWYRLSVVRQKGESQNVCLKKTEHAKFSEKNEHSLAPNTHTYVRVSGGKKYLFFQKIWGALFSWNTRFEIHPFASLPTRRYFTKYFLKKISGNVITKYSKH